MCVCVCVPAGNTGNMQWSCLLTNPLHVQSNKRVMGESSKHSKTLTWRRWWCRWRKRARPVGEARRGGARTSPCPPHHRQPHARTRESQPTNQAVTSWPCPPPTRALGVYTYPTSRAAASWGTTSVLRGSCWCAVVQRVVHYVSVPGAC